MFAIIIKNIGTAMEITGTHYSDTYIEKKSN